MNLQDAKCLAVNLMAEHKLYNWRFQFDNAKRRFGRCSYRRKVISLSSIITELNDEVHVRDTILHEIAHALVGHKHGHDEVWRRKAIEIGCNGERCYSTEKVKQPESKYIATCNSCGKVAKAYRKPQTRRSCGICCNVFNPDYELKYTLNPKY